MPTVPESEIRRQARSQSGDWEREETGKGALTVSYPAFVAQNDRVLDLETRLKAVRDPEARRGEATELQGVETFPKRFA